VNNAALSHEVKKEKLWYVYIVHCRDKSLYTGITTDISRRLTEHNSTDKGAKYTRPRRPVSLVYQEVALTRAAAASREYQIKKLTTAAKRQLIATAPLTQPCIDGPPRSDNEHY
jgi:putative endonuclease